MESPEDLEDVMETKLRENLKWSMLFFIFNYISSEIAKKDKDSKEVRSSWNWFFKRSLHKATFRHTWYRYHCWKANEVNK